MPTDKELKKERGTILSNQGYKCYLCKVSQGALVINSDSKEYIQIDKFEQEYYRLRGITSFKIHLRILRYFEHSNDSGLSAKRGLCPKCSQIALKQLRSKDAISHKSYDEFLNLKLITKTKNFIHSETGKRLTTKSAIALIFIIQNNSTHE